MNLLTTKVFIEHPRLHRVVKYRIVHKFHTEFWVRNLTKKEQTSQMFVNKEMFTKEECF